MFLSYSASKGVNFISYDKSYSQEEAEGSLIHIFSRYVKRRGLTMTLLIVYERRCFAWYRYVFSSIRHLLLFLKVYRRGGMMVRGLPFPIDLLKELQNSVEMVHFHRTYVQ